jgi:predicted RNA-binding protein Jag
VIRRDLNSYDRRVVHLEVAAIEGAASRSVGEGHERRVEIYAAGKNQEGGEE